MRTNSSRPSKESGSGHHHHHHHHKHNKRDSKSSNVNRVDFCNLRDTPQEEDDSSVANPFAIDADMMMNWKLREVAMYKQQQKLNNYLKSQQNLLHSNQNTDR